MFIKFLIDIMIVIGYIQQHTSQIL